jgi:hypothetical protein
VPGISGPSVNALSVTVTATPDTLPQDGTSQSRIVIKAFNAGGQPYPNLSVRLDMQVNGGTTQDLGTLGARTLLTAADGTASTMYTAPAGPGVGGLGAVVAVVATPIASDAANSGVLNSVGALFQAFVHLVPSGTSIPPQTETPTAIIASVTPATPTVGATVLFNGTTSCPSGLNGSACAAATSTLTNWDWDFGDGTAHGSGSVTTHAYSAPRPYAVSLVVTNSQGTRSNPAISVVTVAIPDAINPTAAFVPSTKTAAVNDVISFDASASSPSTGGSIVLYTWTFGDGTTTSTANPTVTHSYASAGAKTVTLTVTDSRGRTSAAATQTITIG